MKNILFLCTGNSCRSQMAEGWTKVLLAGKVQAYSAGTSPQDLNPYAVKTMAQQGIDISSQWAKNVTDLTNIRFDEVYTVCSHADQNCPVFAGEVKVIHRGFDDPPHLAVNLTDEMKILEIYTQVCLEIKNWVATLGV